jgi:hypothetical protein
LIRNHLIHGNDLTVPATSGTPFDTKSWALAWLADTSKTWPAKFRTKSLGKSDGRG